MRRLQWILLALCFTVTGAAWADPPDPLCCAADVTGDGIVDQDDYDYCEGWIPPPPECDLNGDDYIWDTYDQMIMSSCWGVPCTAAAPSLTPIGVGLAAGAMLMAVAWVHRRRRSAEMRRPPRFSS